VVGYVVEFRSVTSLLAIAMSASLGVLGCGRQKSSFSASSGYSQERLEGDSKGSEADSSGINSSATNQPGASDNPASDAKVQEETEAADKEDTINADGKSDKLLPGVIANLRVVVPEGKLNSGTVVSIDFDSTNIENFSRLEVFWRSGSGEWMSVVNAQRVATGFSFVYGDRNPGPFAVKVVGTQRVAGAAAVSLEAYWAPSLFLSAVVTRTVRCLFCHIRVEGDVGGIDFPANGQMHVASGTGMNIRGRLYSTTTVPDLLKGSAVLGYVENYTNQGKKIFPKSLIFPAIPKAELTEKMRGTLKGGIIELNSAAGKSVVPEIVQRTIGNVVLDGRAKPLEFSGDIFVDGDVVIAGSYKGVGTLYANNIFVIGDLTALRSPFPFPENEAQAVDKARAVLSAGTDALYLAALNSVVVGDPNHGFQRNQSINGVETPVPRWITNERLEGLSKPRLLQEEFKHPDGSPGSWFPYPTGDQGPSSSKIEVSRLDAYVFANVAFVWQAWGNLLLNGGYMSPHSVLSSATQITTGTWWCSNPNRRDAATAVPNSCGTKNEVLINPRNGLATHTNVIRFDYRLQAGVPALEALQTIMNR
jgi:hypothetical protein